MEDYFYRWKGGKGETEPPPARYQTAADEALLWAEWFEQGVTFSDMKVTPTPGLLCAISGYTRGTNKANSEETSGKNVHTAGPKLKYDKGRYSDDA